MKENNGDLNLSTLKEMLLDEHKLITYISLSKDLCIHVNESKKLLDLIVEDIRKKDKNVALNVNYVISGLLETNKAQTVVCNETELSKLRMKFKIIFFQHLYSVSVGDSLADIVSFMAVNKFEDFSLCNGFIKSDECVKRQADELGHLITCSREIISSAKEENNEEKCNTSNNTINKDQQVKLEPKLEIFSPKKDLSNNIVKKNDRKTAQKGIAGFFNRNASASVKKPINGVNDIRKETSTKSENEIVDVQVKTENIDVNKKENILKPEKEVVKTEKMDLDEPNEIIQNGKQKVNSSKDKLLREIKKSASLDKKRKRVLHVSDSESDDDEKNDPFVRESVNVEQESDDEIPPTPVISTVKITSGLVNPKKKRKFVDKTYTDEDGYMLTKKEEVYESCSELEEEANIKENIQIVNKVKKEVSPKEKKNGTKNNKKKNSSPQKGKQSTINSFFKKV